MKKIISILLFACAGALAACDFLDVVPEGQATQEDIFKTSKEARKYLNTLYTYAPNIAAYRYMPDFCAGDDIITATNGQTRYFPYKSMLYNEENASQTYYGLCAAAPPLSPALCPAPHLMYGLLTISLAMLRSPAHGASAPTAVDHWCA